MGGGCSVGKASCHPIPSPPTMCESAFDGDTEHPTPNIVLSISVNEEMHSQALIKVKTMQAAFLKKIAFNCLKQLNCINKMYK